MEACTVGFSIRNPLVGDSTKHSLHQMLSDLAMAMDGAWTRQCVTCAMVGSN
jgi:hypothetical protein